MWYHISQFKGEFFMAYSKLDIENIMKNAILFDNKLVIANSQLFDSIQEVELTDEVKRLIDCVNEMYNDYIQSLKQFDEKDLLLIFQAFKQNEIVDNHAIERENPFLLREYMQTRHGYAIDYLIKKLFKEKNTLNSSILTKTHEILIRGTSNSNQILGYRKNNQAYVSFIKNGITCVRYFPISYDEINDVLPLIFDYFNAPLTKESDLFVIPILIHLILAALQLFYDGNTRLARTLAHLKLFLLDNELSTLPVTQPILYYSKQIFPYFDQYRDLIYQFVLNHDNESLNNWIKFNLYRIMDQLYLNDNSLNLVRKK